MVTPHAEIDPADVGLDPHRLAVVDRHFQRYIDSGQLPGWLLVVARHGQVAQVTAASRRDLEADQPVEVDTIWRIYSMTKPITVATVPALWERGAFELKDPVRDDTRHSIGRGCGAAGRRCDRRPSRRPRNRGCGTR
jgi:CubicO group peptidase (beta-lactamase class C family)